MPSRPLPAPAPRRTSTSQKRRSRRKRFEEDFLEEWTALARRFPPPPEKSAEAFKYVGERLEELTAEEEHDSELLGVLWLADEGDAYAKSEASSIRSEMASWEKDREVCRWARAHALHSFSSYLCRGNSFRADEKRGLYMYRPARPEFDAMCARAERMSRLVLELEEHLASGAPGFVELEVSTRTDGAQFVRVAEMRAIRELRPLLRSYRERCERLAREGVAEDPLQPNSKTNPPVEYERDWLALLLREPSFKDPAAGTAEVPSRKESRLSWPTIATALNEVDLLARGQRPDDADVSEMVRNGAARLLSKSNGSNK